MIVILLLFNLEIAVLYSRFILFFYAVAALKINQSCWSTCGLLTRVCKPSL